MKKIWEEIREKLLSKIIIEWYEVNIHSEESQNLSKIISVLRQKPDYVFILQFAVLFICRKVYRNACYLPLELYYC